MAITVHSIHAFSHNGQGGNPAGLVLHSEHLDRKTKQQIARIVGYSETAFIEKSNTADFKISFFTPKEEVDLCGHATIGSFSYMLSKNLLTFGKYSIETKNDILQIQINENSTVSLFQPLPQFFDILPLDEVADSLDITPDQLMKELPIQIVSTGLRDILIPIKNRDILSTITPDFSKITRISEKYNVIGYHLFTLDTVSEKSTAHCRNFAPLYDIPEESATGTSNGALSCYLHQYNILNNNRSPLIFEQGFTMNQPSRIQVELRIDSFGKIIAVKVGGNARINKDILLEVE